MVGKRMKKVKTDLEDFEKGATDAFDVQIRKYDWDKLKELLVSIGSLNSLFPLREIKALQKVLEDGLVKRQLNPYEHQGKVGELRDVIDSTFTDYVSKHPEYSLSDGAGQLELLTTKIDGIFEKYVSEHPECQDVWDILHDNLTTIGTSTDPDFFW